MSGSPTLPDSSLEGLVSVVVPVYNGAATIDACLRSVLDVDFPPDRLEVIVVDNASTDETPTVLERYRGQLRILSEATRGPAAARNAGVRAARGEWIAFTDADCVVDRAWLRHLLPPLRDATVGITGGTILATRPSNRIERFGETIHDHRRAMEEFVPHYAITMSWASRRGALIETGLFDEGLLRGEDVDLAYRMQSLGYRLVYCPEAVMFHRNESTFGGLFREGMAHGMAAAMIHAKHERRLRRARPYSIGHQLLGHARRFLVGSSAKTDGRFEAFCAVVFDLGKAAGGLTTRRRLRRSCRVGAHEGVRTDG